MDISGSLKKSIYKSIYTWLSCRIQGVAYRDLFMYPPSAIYK